MACNPNPSPRLIEWTEAKNPGTLLAKMVKEVVDAKAADRGTMQDAAERAARWFDDLNSTDVGQVVAKLVEKGFIKADPEGIGGFVQDGMNLSIEDSAAALVSLKTILQASAGALGDKADELLLRINAGEDSFEAARQFARQAINTNVISSTILDYDKQFGQGLLLQQLQGNGELKAWMGKIGISDADQRKLYVEKSTDVLKSVVEGINSGDAEKITEGLLGVKRYAELIKAVGTPDRQLDVAHGFKAYGDLAWTVAVNGLLSRPTTVITNLASVSYAFARPAFQVLGALPTAVTGVGPGGRKAALDSIQIAAAELGGMTGAIQDALNLGWQSVVDNRSIYGVNPDWSRKTSEMAIRENGGWNGFFFREQGLNIEPGDTLWGVIDTLGTVISAPGKLLQGGDEAIKHLVWRGQLQAEGMRAAIADGIDLGDKVALRAKLQAQKELMFNPAAPNLRDQWQVKESFKQDFKTRYEFANEQVLQATFQEENAFASGIYKVLQTPVIGAMIRPWVPFVRTPTNILKQGFIDSTGIGAAWRAGQLAVSDYGYNVFKGIDAVYKDAAKDPASYYRHMGQTAFTAMLVSTVYGLVMNGQAVGGGPQRWSGKVGPGRKDEQDAWLRAKQAQGFSGVYQIKIGDTIVPLGQFGEPLNTIAKMAIDMGEASGYMKSREQDENMAFIISIATTGLYQNSFLQGINNFVDMIGNPDRDGSKLVKGAQQYARVYTPFGGLMNWVANIEDPYKKYIPSNSTKAIWGDGGEWDSVWDNMTRPLRERMGGLGNAGNIPSRVDPIFGQPVPRYPGIGSETHSDPFHLTVPFFPRGVSQADALWERMFQAVPTYRPWRPAGDLLTPHEEMEMNRRTADFKIGGQTKAQALKEYLSRPEVEAKLGPLGKVQSTDPLIAADVREIGSEYDQAIFNQMMAENPALQERAAKVERLNQIKREGEAEPQEKERISTELLQLRKIASRKDRGLPPAQLEPMAIPTR